MPHIRGHRRRRRVSDSYGWAEIGAIILIAVCVAAFVAALNARKLEPVAAQESACHQIYVKSMAGRFIPLYSDVDKIVPVENPFIARGNTYEIHSGVKDFSVTDVPCK